MPSHRLLPAFAGILLLLVMDASAVRAAPAETGTDAEFGQNVRLLREALEHVRSSYVREVDETALVDAAIAAMVGSLDPHSEYLDVASVRAMRSRTRGSFAGVGVRMRREDGLLRIKDLLGDSPARRAGVRAGDILTHVDGAAVRDLTREQLSARLRGPIGTAVTMTLQRGERSFDLTLKRGLVVVPSVRHRIEGTVGYIRLTTFSRQTRSGLTTAVADIERTLGDRLAGYVLDLRDNGGGRLKDAIWVADSFLERGGIVSTRGRRLEKRRAFEATPGDLARGRPIVVLINGRSASASEIVAGALQDHGRAILLGTRSFGKGSIQTIIPLAGATALKLTTSRYYTPSGRAIQAVGIAPDVIVRQTEAEEGSADTQLGRALALLRNAALLNRRDRTH